MKDSRTFTKLAIISVVATLISGVTAFKMVQFGDVTLPAAVFIFPIIYLTGKVIVEVYGIEKAKWVIKAGFTANFLMVICFQLAILLPAPVWFEHSEAFALVLGSTTRVFVAGLSAFLIGSYSNALIMHHMKLRDGDSKVSLRSITSTLISESLDATCFIFIAFYGTMPTEALFTMIWAQAVFKIVYEVIASPLVVKCSGWVKEIENGN